MPISAQDMLNAAFLASAAYDTTPDTSQSRTAEQALAASDRPPAWQLVDLSFFQAHGINSLGTSDFVDGYFSHGNGQALIAYREAAGHKELAISFRGTEIRPNDFLADAIGGAISWNSIYDNFANLISAFTNLANTLGTDKMLVTGHSLGGAMAEMFMAEVSAVYNPVCVTFGSPGVRELGNPSLTNQFLNIQHSGDPVPDATINDVEQGIDVQIRHPEIGDIPSVPALAVIALATGYVGEHARIVYLEPKLLSRIYCNTIRFCCRSRWRCG